MGHGHTTHARLLLCANLLCIICSVFALLCVLLCIVNLLCVLLCVLDRLCISNLLCVRSADVVLCNTYCT
jgi:hypothetical protein